MRVINREVCTGSLRFVKHLILYVFHAQAFTAKYWVNKGVPPESLNIGLALYGRTFTLSDPSRTDVGSPVSGAGKAGRFTAEPGYMAYYEVLTSGQCRSSAAAFIYML